MKSFSTVSFHIPEISGDATHSQRYQMVQVPICWIDELDSPEADVVQSLVVDAEYLVSVLNELMDEESCIVGLHQPDLGDEKGSHA